MYIRRRRLPFTAWLLPLLIIIAVVVAIIFDYREVHRTFNVFGTEVDTHSVTQILVQPSPDNPSPNAPKVYKITAHGQVVTILKNLATATPVSNAAGIINNSLVADNVFIQFQNNSWELQLFQTSLPNQVYLQYNGILFKTSSTLIQAIRPQS